jgi:hypothetical protein
MSKQSFWLGDNPSHDDGAEMNGAAEVVGVEA